MAAEQAKATTVDADIYVESFGNIEEANMVRKRLCLSIYLLVFLEIVFSKFSFFLICHWLCSVICRNLRASHLVYVFLRILFVFLIVSLVISF